MSAIFTPDGDRLMPTELARGPWDPLALHGGPTAAIAVRAVEAHLAAAGPEPWVLSRLTLELLRPVPLEPLRVVAETVRPGRKVTLVTVSVWVDGEGGREVARGLVLAIREAHFDLPAHVKPVPPPPSSPSQLPVSPPFGDWPAFHNAGVEMRYVSGEFRQIGPAAVWMRLLVPVVEGEVTSPSMRTAALADFGNGVSSDLVMGVWRFINPDLTVHFARPPVGEWICLDARTLLSDDGTGLAESALSDESGVFGRSVQSLLVEPM